MQPATEPSCEWSGAFIPQTRQETAIHAGSPQQVPLPAPSGASASTTPQLTPRRRDPQCAASVAADVPEQGTPPSQLPKRTGSASPPARLVNVTSERSTVHGSPSGSTLGGMSFEQAESHGSITQQESAGMDRSSNSISVRSPVRAQPSAAVHQRPFEGDNSFVKRFLKEFVLKWSAQDDNTNVQSTLLGFELSDAAACEGPRNGVAQLVRPSAMDTATSARAQEVFETCRQASQALGQAVVQAAVPRRELNASTATAHYEGAESHTPSGVRRVSTGTWFVGSSNQSCEPTNGTPASMYAGVAGAPMSLRGTVGPEDVAKWEEATHTPTAANNKSPRPGLTVSIEAGDGSSNVSPGVNTTPGDDVAAGKQDPTSPGSRSPHSGAASPRAPGADGPDTRRPSVAQGSPLSAVRRGSRFQPSVADLQGALTDLIELHLDALRALHDHQLNCNRLNERLHHYKHLAARSRYGPRAAAAGHAASSSPGPDGKARAKQLTGTSGVFSVGGRTFMTLKAAGRREASPELTTQQPVVLSRVSSQAHDALGAPSSHDALGPPSQDPSIAASGASNVTFATSDEHAAGSSLPSAIHTTSDSVPLSSDNTRTSQAYSSPGISSVYLHPADSAAGLPADGHMLRTTIDVTVENESDEDDGGVGMSTINQYVLLQELGRGAQGRVMHAVDANTHEVRALKMIPRPAFDGSMSRADHERDVTALQREIAIMKKCRHRNIVTLYEVIDDPSHSSLYLVMQHVEHGSLRSMTDNGLCQPVEPAKLAWYARQLCAGLQYLHSRGVAHRDIKPENILLGDGDTVFLSDFGVSSNSDQSVTPVAGQTPEPDADGNSLGASVRPKKQRGTVAFQPPEKMSAKGQFTTASEKFKAEMRADVYMLGLSLYVMLYGHLPWPMHNAFQYMTAVRSDPIKFPTVVNSAPGSLKKDARASMEPLPFAEDWHALLSAMLEKDAEKRVAIVRARTLAKALHSSYENSGDDDTIEVSEQDLENALTVRSIDTSGS